MDSEDGQIFVKACTGTRVLRLTLYGPFPDFSTLQNFAYFVRTHERAFANALQLQQRNKHGKQAAAGQSGDATTIKLSDALSRPFFPFSSSSIKPAKLTLTPHHLYYLLTKFEDLGVDIGPMNVRLENLQHDNAPINYVSFLGYAPNPRSKQSDAESLKSVSSVRSVMSSMSSMLSNLGLSNSAARAEKQMAQHREDIKYLYSCFTKIPALKLAPDHRARLVSGYEEFPFDTAVPLFAFKNVSTLEICDLDFRQFHGWDRLSEQLRSLTVRRANVEDPIDLLHHIVLDDTERRRKRSFKPQGPTTPSTPGASWSKSSPKPRYVELARTISAPNTPYADLRYGSLGSSHSITPERQGSTEGKQPATPQQRQRSKSPARVPGSRQGSLRKHGRGDSLKYRRSSGSSGSDTHEANSRHSSTDMLALGSLPSSKWQCLRHLCIAENGMTSLTVSSLAPIANNLQSLDLSGNLFSDVPEALASLTHLRALNLSNCMIESLQSLTRNPLPAITTLNLRSNRLSNLAGIERLPSLEKVDVRDNWLRDPMELARLAGLPEVTDLYVIKNPFQRTHPSYRVTIFNAFRATPGRTADVTIDTLGPLYQEKNHLVDRAPEPAVVPVVKPPVEEDEEPQAVAGGALEDDELHALEAMPREPRVQPPGHRRTTSDLGPSAMQRKGKAPRRRIVELSQQETPPRVTVQQAAPDLTEAPRTPTDNTPATPGEETPFHTAPTRQGQPYANWQRPMLDTAFVSPTPAPRIRESSDDELSPQDTVHSDVYRRKIEALKSDLGPGWLAAMNEDRLAEQRDQRRSFSPASRTSTIKASSNADERVVSVGGRTLG